jgi:Tol biopolymer transport system component
MNADGSNDSVLESEAFDPNLVFNTSRHPDWSPDGTLITFASSRSGKLEIWTMNADGSSQFQVTTDPQSDNFSRFSPDGTKIVYQSLHDLGSSLPTEIHVVDVDGRHEINLTADKSRNVQPSWGPVN